MRTKRILVPIDFSEHANAAVEYATSLARATKATLLIVHVEPARDWIGDEEVYSSADEYDEFVIHTMLESVRPTDHRVPWEHRLLRGSPADEILKLAERLNVELIVMGTHGRTGLARVLMGSVAEAVLRRASCPVLTVKQPSREVANADWMARENFDVE